MRLLRLVPLVSAVAALGWMLGPGAARAQEDAEEESEFGRTGFYVGVGGALTKLLDADDALREELSLPSSVDVDVKYSYGANGRGGYRFHSHFAAELEVGWHHRFDADFETGALEIAKATVEPWVVTANTKGYLFKDRFQPYAVLGLGVMTAEFKIKDTTGSGLSRTDRSTGFAARFGGGADMYITRHVVLIAKKSRSFDEVFGKKEK